MISKTIRYLVLAASLIVLCATVIAAQDAGQVLRVSVGFGTLKNTNKDKMPPEKLAEVERLEGLARIANGVGKYGEALKHFYHGMAIMRDMAWTPERALASAVTMKLAHAVLEPGQVVEIKLGQIYALDENLKAKLDGAIVLLKMKGEEPVKEFKALKNVEPDFIAHPFIAEVVVPEVETGNYRISVKLQPSAGEPIVKTATVHIERGLSTQVRAAKDRAAKLQTTLKAKNQSALIAALPTAQYRLTLFDLADSGEISLDRISLSDQLKEATDMLDGLEAGKDPLAQRRGDFKKAYLSGVDNTLQPYRIFVPSSYDKSKPQPLIIALHGMGGDENSYFDAYANGAFKVEAEKRGYIVACPKGRKPASMYVGDAERDVMDVIAEVRRDYNIDANRIYLTGHSMGGYGTWSVAMNHPDVFAALAPVAGGSLNPKNMSKIAHIPQLVIHGDDDKTVPVERSRDMVAIGKQLGVEMKYIEVPGGNHIDVVTPHFKDVFDWFDSHRRKAAEAKASAAAKSN